jgi:PAS domain S-box-containing protein
MGLAALSTLPDTPIAIFDADGRCVAVYGERSSLEARIGGREALIGRAAEEYVGREADVFRRTLASVLASGKPSSIRALVPISSDYFVFDVTLWPLPGEPLVACMLRGVRQLDRFEQRLDAMRSRFRPAVEQTAHFLCEIDAAGTIVYVGERSRELGLEPEALVGTDVRGIASRTPSTHPDDAATADAAIARFVDTESSLTPYRLRLRDRTGRWLDVECTGAWYTTRAGARRGLIVCRDIEAPFASAFGQGLQHGLSRLAGGRVDAVIELTVDGTIVCSTPLPPTWAGSGEALAGSDVLSFVHPEDRDRAQRELSDPARQPGDEPTLLRWRGAAGDWRCLEVWALRFEVEGGEEHWMTMGRDVTPEREPPEEWAWEESFESLQRSNLALIAGGVAHDFNNLLSISLGVADLASEQLPPDSQARAYLSEIIDASRQAAELARQLLAATGRVSATLGPVEVNSVLASMESLLRTGLPKGARLEYALCHEPLWVEGDATQLRQVILNLVTNAGDAISREDGVVRVATARATHSLLDPASEGFATIEVRDNGRGIDAETLQRIFEPRFTTKATGHGLGLAVVQSVVRRHRGRLHAASADDGGTTFRIEIPALPERDVVAERLLSSKHFEARRSGASVLIVDDDLGVLRMSAAMLSAAQFRVLEAANARAALELIAREPEVACAVVDLVLPDADGLALVDELRRRKPILPVVVCSGAVNRIPTDRADLVLLEKPFRYSQLIEAVWRSLST